MSVEIYYFSGTGNSLAVAKDIAEKTRGRLIPIASTKNRESITPDADAVGIVFPVYYGELPVLVKEFAQKLENIKGRYVFAVSTYGGAAMASMWMLKKILGAKGAALSASYGVHMPQNSFLKPRENRQKLYAAWKRRLGTIVHNTELKKEFCSHALEDLFFVPLQFGLIRPMCKSFFRKQTKLPRGTRIEKLIRAMDEGFCANDKRTGCGVCARVCPAGNIAIRENRPVWLHRCETCLACYNWCPNRAIQGGITKNHYYRHPAVTLPEMLERAKNKK